MASNKRTEIRDAVKELLDGETEAGSNVYVNRETSLWQSELPAILIYTNQESSVPNSINLKRYIRTLELKIEVKVEESEAVDEEIDALLAEIEEIVSENISLSGTVLSTKQISTEIEFDTSGEKPLGVGTLTFECQYIS